MLAVFHNSGLTAKSELCGDTYCIDDALLKALNKKRAAGSYFELVWLGFAPSAEEA